MSKDAFNIIWWRTSEFRLIPLLRVCLRAPVHGDLGFRLEGLPKPSTLPSWS